MGAQDLHQDVSVAGTQRGSGVRVRERYDLELINAAVSMVLQFDHNIARICFGYGSQTEL